MGQYIRHLAVAAAGQWVASVAPGPDMAGKTNQNLQRLGTRNTADLLDFANGISRRDHAIHILEIE